MVLLRLTEEQAEQLRQALSQPVQLCDPRGEVLGWVEPVHQKNSEPLELCDSSGAVVGRFETPLTKEYVAQLKKKARSAGPWYTGEQVQRRLQALQAERERIGDFDEAHMRDLLKRLNGEDPGHMRPEHQE